MINNYRQIAKRIGTDRDTLVVLLTKVLKNSKNPDSALYFLKVTMLEINAKKIESIVFADFENRESLKTDIGNKLSDGIKTLKEKYLKVQEQ